MNYERLKKVLVSILSTESHGERANGVRSLRKMLDEEKHDVHWLVDHIKDPSIKLWPAPLLVQEEVVPWQFMVDYCADNHHRLSDREKDLVRSVWRGARRSDDWVPSRKQTSWLSGIYKRLKITEIPT